MIERPQVERDRSADAALHGHLDANRIGVGEHQGGEGGTATRAEHLDRRPVDHDAEFEGSVVDRQGGVEMVGERRVEAGAVASAMRCSYEMPSSPV